MAIRSYTTQIRATYEVIKTPYVEELHGTFAPAKPFFQELHGTFEHPKEPYVDELHGTWEAPKAYVHELHGVIAAALDSVKGYELYIGIDAVPDPDTVAPDQTSLTLPFDSLTMSGVGPATLFLVTRYRNAYDVVSRNLNAISLEIDANDEVVANAPAAPIEITIAPAASGTMTIEANYYYDPDDTEAADTWAIFLSSDGTDPLLSAVFDTVTMSLSRGIARLRYTTTAFADGLTIKAVIRSRRIDAGPVNVDSTNTAIVSAVSDTDGPAAANATALFANRGTNGS